MVAAAASSTGADVRGFERNTDIPTAERSNRSETGSGFGEEVRTI